MTPASLKMQRILLNCMALGVGSEGRVVQESQEIGPRIGPLVPKCPHNPRTTPAQPPHNPCAAEVWEQRTQFQFDCSGWGVCSDLRMLPQALAKVSNIYDFACPGAQNHRFGSSPWKVKSMILLALASKIIDLGICDGG